ncbi:hypothetical protein BB558_003212 [Smittium angustum]|uniref:Uncharacterized protein n=1 Tax=Smittium angustum TaxID=133377 RepID=A0A2U1J6M7_SMIAN|nr:hypothetical protein BB558_003212 [Smittium angustum]
MSNIQAFLDGLKYLLEQENPPPPEHLQIVIENTPRQDIVSSLVVAIMCWEPTTLKSLLNLLLKPHVNPPAKPIQKNTQNQLYPKRYLNATFFETMLLQLKTLPPTQLVVGPWLQNLGSTIETTILMAKEVLKRVSSNNPIQGNSEFGNTPFYSQSKNQPHIDEGEEIGDIELASKGGLTIRDWESISLISNYVFTMLVPSVGNLSSMWKLEDTALNYTETSPESISSLDGYSASNVSIRREVMPVSSTLLKLIQLYSEWCAIVRKNCLNIGSLIYERIPAVIKGNDNEGFIWGISALPITVASNLMSNILIRRIFLSPYRRCTEIQDRIGGMFNEVWFKQILQLESKLEETEIEIMGELISNDSSIIYGVIARCFKLLQIHNIWTGGSEIGLTEANIKENMKPINPNDPNSVYTYMKNLQLLFEVRQVSDGLAPILGYEKNVFANAMNMQELMLSILPMRSEIINKSKFSSQWGYFTPGSISSAFESVMQENINLKKENFTDHTNSEVTKDKVSERSRKKLKRKNMMDNKSIGESDDKQFADTVYEYNFPDFIEIMLIRMLALKLETNELSENQSQLLTNLLVSESSQLSSLERRKSSNTSNTYNKAPETKKIEFITSLALIARQLSCLTDLYICPNMFYFGGKLVLPEEENIGSEYYNMIDVPTLWLDWSVKFGFTVGKDSNTKFNFLSWADMLLELNLIDSNVRLPRIWERVLNWVDTNAYQMFKQFPNFTKKNFSKIVEILTQDFSSRLSKPIDVACKPFTKKFGQTKIELNVLLAMYGSLDRIIQANKDTTLLLAPEKPQNTNSDKLDQNNPNTNNTSSNDTVEKNNDLFSLPIMNFEDEFNTRWKQHLIRKGAGPIALTHYLYLGVVGLSKDNRITENNLSKQIFEFLVSIKTMISEPVFKPKKSNQYTLSYEQKKILNDSYRILLGEIFSKSMMNLKSGYNGTFNVVFGQVKNQNFVFQKNKMVQTFNTINLHINRLSQLLGELYESLNNVGRKKKKELVFDSIFFTKKTESSRFWSSLRKFCESGGKKEVEISELNDLQEAIRGLLPRRFFNRKNTTQSETPTEPKFFKLYEKLEQNDESEGNEKKPNYKNTPETQQNPNRQKINPNTIRSVKFEDNTSFLASEDLGGLVKYNPESIEFAEIIYETLQFQITIESSISFKKNFSMIVSHIYPTQHKTKTLELALIIFIVQNPGCSVEGILGPIVDKMWKNTIGYNRKESFFQQIRNLFKPLEGNENEWLSRISSKKDSSESSLTVIDKNEYGNYGYDDEYFKLIGSCGSNGTDVSLQLHLVKFARLRILIFLTSLKYGKSHGQTPIYAWITDLLSYSSQETLNNYILIIMCVGIYGPRNLSTNPSPFTVPFRIFDNSYHQESVWDSKVCSLLEHWFKDERVCSKLVVSVSLSLAKISWYAGKYIFEHESRFANLFSFIPNYVQTENLLNMQSFLTIKESAMKYLHLFFIEEKTTPAHRKVIMASLLSPPTSGNSIRNFSKFVEEVMVATRETPCDWFFVHFLPVLLDVSCKDFPRWLYDSFTLDLQKVCKIFVYNLFINDELCNILIPKTDTIGNSLEYVIPNYSENGSGGKKIYNPRFPLSRILDYIESMTSNQQEEIVENILCPSLLSMISFVIYGGEIDTKSKEFETIVNSYVSINEHKNVSKLMEICNEISSDKSVFETFGQKTHSFKSNYKEKRVKYLINFLASHILVSKSKPVYNLLKSINVLNKYHILEIGEEMDATNTNKTYLNEPKNRISQTASDSDIKCIFKCFLEPLLLPLDCDLSVGLKCPKSAYMNQLNIEPSDFVAETIIAILKSTINLGSDTNIILKELEELVIECFWKNFVEIEAVSMFNGINMSFLLSANDQKPGNVGAILLKELEFFRKIVEHIYPNELENDINSHIFILFTRALGRSDKFLSSLASECYTQASYMKRGHRDSSVPYQKPMHNGTKTSGNEYGESAIEQLLSVAKKTKSFARSIEVLNKILVAVVEEEQNTMYNGIKSSFEIRPIEKQILGELFRRFSGSQMFVETILGLVSSNSIFMVPESSKLICQLLLNLSKFGDSVYSLIDFSQLFNSLLLIHIEKPGNGLQGIGELKKPILLSSGKTIKFTELCYQFYKWTDIVPIIPLK